jgi:hypothetical protein
VVGAAALAVAVDKVPVAVMAVGRPPESELTVASVMPRRDPMDAQMPASEMLQIALMGALMLVSIGLGWRPIIAGKLSENCEKIPASRTLFM